MGRYIESDDSTAEMLFERLIGYPYAVTSITEELSFTKGKGCQVQLARFPLEIEACEGYLEYKDFHMKGWSPIALEHIIVQGNVLDIPASIFGIRYKIVKVTYKAGNLEIPQDIKDAVGEISDALKKPNMTTWNIPLSHDTLLTIEHYKKKGEGIL